MPDDEILTQSYHRFARCHDVYLDTILCDPSVRVPFLEQLRAELGDELSEAELLLRLVYLRKRGMLGRRKPR